MEAAAMNRVCMDGVVSGSRGQGKRAARVRADDTSFAALRRKETLKGG